MSTFVLQDLYPMLTFIIQCKTMFPSLSISSEKMLEIFFFSFLSNCI